MKKAGDTKKILVLGDLIIDAYHHGSYLGQSIDNKETPVAFKEEATYTWGGAGLLVQNILALGASVSFITIIGGDDYAKHATAVTHQNLQKLFAKIDSRKTPTKERFWIKDKKLLEWHHFDNKPLTLSEEKEIEKLFFEELESSHKVLIADYRHGLLSPRLAKKIIDACNTLGKPVYVDSQIAYNNGNHKWYQEAFLICLNEMEAKSIYPKFDKKNNVQDSLRKIQKILKTQNVVVKVGGQGSLALLGGTFLSVPAHPVKPKDTSGAGDAFLGCLAISDALPTYSDIQRANIWAGLSTETIGTTLPTISKYHSVLSKKKNLQREQ